MAFYRGSLAIVNIFLSQVPDLDGGSGLVNTRLSLPHGGSGYGGNGDHVNFYIGMHT